MGYTTDFEGRIEVNPPLNGEEIAYLRKFSGTRRMARTKGPYYVDSEGYKGQEREKDITDYNQSPKGQPGLWCQWEPTSDGTAIIWDGGEKFYYSVEWMQYIIDHFFKEDAVVSCINDPQFKHFTFDHDFYGIIEAQGEEPSDHWFLVVRDNVARKETGPDMIFTRSKVMRVG